MSLRRFFCKESWFRNKQVVFYDIDSVVQRKRGAPEFQKNFCKFYESLAIIEHQQALVSNVGLETFQTLDKSLKGKDIGFNLQQRFETPLYGGLTSVFSQNIFLSDWPFCSRNPYLDLLSESGLKGSNCAVILDKENQDLIMKAEEAGLEVVQFGKDFHTYKELLDEINDIVFYFCELSP